MPLRRTGPRKTRICRVAAFWTDEEGTVTRLVGLLEDRSRQGASISVSEPIAVGIKVTIRGRTRELDGTVRHCRYAAGKYLIGIRLDQEDPDWDRFAAGF
jgi:hypothetical protein